MKSTGVTDAAVLSEARNAGHPVWVEEDNEVRWKMILIVTLGLTLIIVVALTYGSRRWESATREMHVKLEATRRPIGRKTYSPDELIGLPAPVQKYFQTVLRDGQPIVSAVHLEFSGTINMSATGEQWKRFTSTQRVIAQRPGFHWEGHIEETSVRGI